MEEVLGQGAKEVGMADYDKQEFCKTCVLEGNDRTGFIGYECLPLLWF